MSSRLQSRFLIIFGSIRQKRKGRKGCGGSWGKSYFISKVVIKNITKQFQVVDTILLFYYSIKCSSYTKHSFQVLLYNDK